MIECKICGEKFATIGRHLKKHKINTKDYYDMYILKDISEKTCKMEGCNNITNFNGNGYRELCSQACVVKKAHSVESILKVKATWKKLLNSEKGTQLKKDRSERQTGKNNTRFNRSEEDWKKSYKKQSISIKEKIKNGEFTPCVTNSWANSKCCLQIDGFDKFYRSSWDAAFQILNPDCEYETLRIQYISPKDNQQHSYIVDFIDNENKIIYEIKPDSNKNDEIVKAKEHAAKLWCKENNYIFKFISNDWFKKNANKIEFEKYDNKIKKGMKQFL